VQRQVQFKFGLCRQIDYQVGDVITFGPSHSDVGERDAHVLVDGAPEECPVCGYVPDDEEVFVIEVDKGAIVAVGVADSPLATRLLASGAIRLG
jgi:hypothetical protein